MPADRSRAAAVPSTAVPSAGFDVAAEPPFGGDILNIAEGQPDLFRWHSGGEGLVRGAAAHARQHQGAAEHPGVSRAELVVHKPPKVADSHR